MLCWNTRSQQRAKCDTETHVLNTGWRRPKGCLRLQVNFRKRATNYGALLQKLTSKHKAPYLSLPPCIVLLQKSFAHNPYISSKEPLMMALLRKMTYKDKAPYGSMPPCIVFLQKNCTHDPYKSSKEPYILSKEPWISSKEPYILSKEPYMLSKVPYTLSKEPYILSKEPHVLSHKALYILKSKHDSF